MTGPRNGSQLAAALEWTQPAAARDGRLRVLITRSHRSCRSAQHPIRWPASARARPFSRSLPAAVAARTADLPRRERRDPR